jgi:cytochrome c oxidase cbb3-type subunit III
MADMPTEFWGGWIVVVTVTTLIGLAWLVLNVYFGKDDAAEIAEQTWDETLREGTAAAPMWWFWFILALMAVSVVYLILYPGLGTFAGTLHWSQGHEITTSAEHYEQQFGAERRRIAATDASALGGDAAAMRSAARIFNNHCASCHGTDARGQAGLFPDLTDTEWQWGGTAAQIEQTLSTGRQGVMPPWQAALNDDGVAEVADYVLALAAGRTAEPAFAASKARYEAFCSACHAVDGSGNALLGAPALNDDIWLYGGSRAAIIESIGLGRSGMMPGFRTRLDRTQLRLLTAWLLAGAATADSP